MVMEP